MNKYKDIFITTTDTVCGIGGPVNSQTLALIYELKQRPIDKKIIILVGSIAQAQKFSQWNSKANDLAHKYWPGNVSLIVSGQGFRMPNQNLLIEFLLKNGPMYVSSANISGNKPINIEQAREFFPQIKQVYNFGSTSGKASRIFNVDTNEWIR
ncbi:Sua5/YciO/YrdC/YwlC family protein [Mycoplasmopsis phocirhinis]|uniref:L-threonylcarbamoyladenylate synthase n=1 Tax=Mycoplasmopsis phocirhinis TaxID=142650 RepID=A0A4P6MRQ1_9BACT|nr:Sua5/YciO/YrdC/YwlC family protein [Mycoplasmopsis phocirhinis]QBF34511.1 Sua5/YciO/YrdC/YwlC family protein [Mycoplasmopsis phocirhinis]